MAVLYVGSDQPRAGKTALGITLVGIFRKRGVSAAILKPWTSAAAPGGDADPGAYGALLGQGPQAPAAPVGDGFSDALLEDAARAAAQAARGVDILVVEGLSQAAPEDAVRIVDALDAKAVIVARFEPGMTPRGLVEYGDALGERLTGIVVNGLTRYQTAESNAAVVPAPDSSGLKLLGIVPEDRTLLGVTVPQIAETLGGRFIRGEEVSGGLVEYVLVGGLGLDNGVGYFALRKNKAALVRGDRPDIQMAALQTPTSCMVLTNGIEPIEYVLNEAEVEEVPLILVESDTLGAMDALGSAMDAARFDHPSKLARFEEMVSEHVDVEAITASLGLPA